MNCKHSEKICVCWLGLGLAMSLTWLVATVTTINVTNGGDNG